MKDNIKNKSESYTNNTIRIIKSGNRNQIKRATCNCGCIFEFVKIKDEIYGDPTDSIKGSNRYVRCPECDNLIKTRDYEEELKEIKKYFEGK